MAGRNFSKHLEGFPELAHDPATEGVCEYFFREHLFEYIVQFLFRTKAKSGDSRPAFELALYIFCYVLIHFLHGVDKSHPVAIEVHGGQAG